MLLCKLLDFTAPGKPLPAHTHVRLRQTNAGDGNVCNSGFDEQRRRMLTFWHPSFPIQHYSFHLHHLISSLGLVIYNISFRFFSFKQVYLGLFLDEPNYALCRSRISSQNIVASFLQKTKVIYTLLGISQLPMGGPRIDVKDRKLLEILTDNGKLPINQLAKQIGLSRESTAYRIKRLKRHGILRRVIAKVDMTRFYQNAYAMFMKFAKLDDAVLKHAIEILSKNPFVMWVGSLGGEYDLGVSFLTRTPADLGKFMEEIELAFGKNKRYELFPYEREYKNTFRGVLSKSGGLISEALITDFQPQKLVELDRKDKTILYALSKDAELTNRELASFVGLSEEGVRLRIKQLEKARIIQGYRALIDMNKLGVDVYYALMRFDNLVGMQEKKVETYIQMNPHVYYCAKIIGKYNMQANFWANNTHHFHRILQELRNVFSDSLYSFRTQIVFGEHQHTYFPPAAIIGSADVEKVDAFFARRNWVA
jgi:Lrp/AsnC family leucine-responsive transcriptional regulator